MVALYISALAVVCVGGRVVYLEHIVLIRQNEFV